MKNNDQEKKVRVVEGRSLIDLVFSWSFNDVLRKNFYKNQVKQIPDTFSSTAQYLRSFVTPLLEETHADLKSSTETVSQSSPCCRVRSVKRAKGFKLPKDLFYTLVLDSPDHRFNRDNKVKDYEPENGDLVALTSVRPKSRYDLAGNFVVAKVLRVGDDKLVTLSVLSSKPIGIEERSQTNTTLYAVYLINMTTNIRIWEALHSDPNDTNTSIIEKTLQLKFLDDEETCAMCSSGFGVQNYSGETSLVEREKLQSSDLNEASLVEREKLRSSDLNESQKSAVLSCIRARECRHRSSVKLIWGPPGTGKTKTIGFLLHSLLGMKCRTLTCAPTNVAVLQVTERLMRRVADSAKLRDGRYGLGDIVLSGNGERMKIEEREDLHDVFLDYRIEALDICFAPRTGWTNSLLSMIGLLEDPKELYRVYLEELKIAEGGPEDDQGSDNNDEEEGSGEISDEKKMKKKRGSKKLSQALLAILKENNKSNKKLNKDKKKKESKSKPGDKKEEEIHNDVVAPLSFEEFVKKRFGIFAERLYFCAPILYTHLPTSLISLETANRMLEAVDSLKSFQILLRGVTDDELNQAFDIIADGGSNVLGKFNVAKERTAFLLKSLPLNFPVPVSSNTYPDAKMLREFCLNKACLIFCTVSSSAKIRGGQIPLEMLVVDEAAQLKECELTIPLQLPGIRHAILIGDEKQLPAMVKSKACEEANFGRSLFERLASLGHKKHLLNVQHRMHPSISSFPNREFYENKILDGQNVKLRSYCKRFLQGKMFGSYSFINVAHGRETVDTSRSSKNMVEASVVAEIVERLYKEVKSSKRKITVGVISPYKAQVYAISDAIGKKYASSNNNNFSLTVRSVDGFQGGEEDVIIISTVRSNGTGYVGFLSDCQRANVALTRARHCLWIVGSGVTLSGSSSVWKRLITDAKQRGCYHNADDDQNLAQTIAISLIDQLKHTNVSPNNLVSFLFKKTSWKVLFDDSFWRSMTRIENNGVRKEVLSMIEKLSQGWRNLKNNETSLSSSRLVEHYRVNKKMWLVWAVEILRENSNDVQVLKVWDVSALSDLPRLSDHLDRAYGSYTLETLSRCKYRFEERGLVVPMKWPLQASFVEADPVNFLSKSLSLLGLKKGLTSSASNRI